MTAIKQKNIFVLSFLFALTIFSHSTQADNFFGVQPGVTTRQQAEQILGAPLKNSALGDKAEYSGAAFDAKKIIIHYQLNSAIVERVDIYPEIEAKAEEYRRWMDLGAPSDVTQDFDGTRFETYASRGVVFKFSGFEVTDPVVMIIHIPVPGASAPGQHQNSGSLSQPFSEPVRKAGPGEEIIYLGIDFDCQPDGVHATWVYPNSPAERGRLQKGDIIKSIGGYPVLSESAFFKTVQKLPKYQPLNFAVQRGRKTYTTIITLEYKLFDEVQSEVQQERQRRQQMVEQEQAEKESARQRLGESFGKMIDIIKKEINNFNAE